MATAAAHAAVMAKQRARKALLEKTKTMSAPMRLNDRQKQKLMKTLHGNDSTVFLAELVQDADTVEPESAPEEVDESKIKFELPEVCPWYLSQRHFDFLKVFVEKGNHLPPSWMNAYWGAPSSVKKAPPPKAKAQWLSSSSMVSTNEKSQLSSSSLVSQSEKVPVVTPLGGGESGSDDNHLESVARNGGHGDNTFLHLYNEFVLVNQVVANGPKFSTLVVVCIIIAGILVGIQSYPQMDNNEALAALDLAVQCVFTADCALKIFMAGRYPLDYWLGPERSWNNFDFWLVAICWLPPEATGGNVAFLRLLRLMRLLKLVGKVKQLQIIVFGLMRGLSSVVYILLLLLLVFYLFAIVGVGTFRKNDPFHFGGLGVTMVTLFRIATLDNWSAAMFVTYYGCTTQYGGVDGLYLGLDDGTPYFPGELAKRGGEIKAILGDFDKRSCWRPRSQPPLAAAYFIFFVLVAAFVVLSLFIGAVCGGMADAMDSFEAAAKLERERLAAEKVKNTNPNGELLLSLRDLFDNIDLDGGGEVDAEELCKSFQRMGEDITVEKAQMMIDLYDKDGSGTMGFNEFVLVMTKGEVTASEATCSAVEAEAAAALSEKLALKLREAWGLEEDTGDSAEPSFLWAAYLAFGVEMGKFAIWPPFVQVMTLTIIVAGALVGIQTELAKPGVPKDRVYPEIEILDSIVLAIFTFEIIVKIIAEGSRPCRYFNDAWNKFDFFIVAACFIFLLPFMPAAGSLLAMLRLLRLLRVLKLVKALPQLRIIVEAVISGLSSITFVTIILFMFFYLFAIIGMIFFGENDPMRFGNLQLALITLFRMATCDGWSDIMYTNMLGCDKYGYTYGRAKYGFASLTVKKWDMSNCKKPKAYGWVAVAFCIISVVFGAQVLLTLFIGIIATSMEEAKMETKNNRERDKRLENRCRLLHVSTDSKAVECCREVFNMLDTKHELALNREQFRPLIGCLEGVHAAHGKLLRRVDIDKLFSVLSVGKDDHFNTLTSATGLAEFPEFFVACDFLRRALEDPNLATSLRTAYLQVQDASRASGGPQAGGGEHGSMLVGAMNAAVEKAASANATPALSRQPSQAPFGGNSGAGPLAGSVGGSLAMGPRAGKRGPQGMSLELSPRDLVKFELAPEDERAGGDGDDEFEAYSKTRRQLREELGALAEVCDQLAGLAAQQWGEVAALEDACEAAWERAQHARMRLVPKGQPTGAAAGAFGASRSDRAYTVADIDRISTGVARSSSDESKIAALRRGRDSKRSSASDEQVAAVYAVNSRQLSPTSQARSQPRRAPQTAGKTTAASAGSGRSRRSWSAENV